MCGRNSLFVLQGDLERRFHATAKQPMPQRYNIAPGDDQATIPNDDPDAIDLYEWGFTPAWDESKHLINARAESVAEKRTFSESFAERRCLVLADGFYEWKGRRGTKQPYRIQLKSGDPFAFAGLWQPYGVGAERRQVTIITTDANETVAPIHDRMPVMFEEHDEAAWLADGDPDELLDLLDPFPDDKLEAYPISTRVNNPANDSPEILEPIDAGDQAGLGEFGAV